MLPSSFLPGLALALSECKQWRPHVGFLQATEVGLNLYSQGPRGAYRRIYTLQAKGYKVASADDGKLVGLSSVPP